MTDITYQEVINSPWTGVLLGLLLLVAWFSFETMVDILRSTR